MFTFYYRLWSTHIGPRNSIELFFTRLSPSWSKQWLEKQKDMVDQEMWFVFLVNDYLLENM